MVHPSLIGIPIELRSRIYSHLLSHTSTSTSSSAPASPLCALLILNRQINAEIITYLKSQLLVLLRTNDEKFISQTLASDGLWQPALPFLSQLRSCDSAIRKNPANAPIAMELEFYKFMSDKEADSFAAFLIPASSLEALAKGQGSPEFYIWTMQVLLSISLHGTFSYTFDEAQKILLQPYVHDFLRPVFVGIETRGVDAEMTALLRQQLKGNYEAGGHLQKLQSLLHGAANGAKGDWGAAAGRFRMTMRYADMLWENHQECLAAPSTGFDAIYILWMIHCNASANLVQALLNMGTGVPMARVPTGGKGDNNEAFVKARQAAEDAIQLLASRPEWGRPETAEAAQVLTALRRSKAKISFKANVACKGMGDVDAAVGYLKEAMKYEPETSAKLLEDIQVLMMEGAKDEEGLPGVVKWE